jgi:hypothetical protein
VREKMRLRATLGDMDGGYAFHDESRVEIARGSPTRPMRVQPEEGASAGRKSLVGAEPDTLPPGQRGHNEPSAAHPNAEQADDDDELESIATNPPPRAKSPAGGAVWEALPSIIGVEQEPANDDGREPDAAPPQAEVEPDAGPSFLDLGRASAMEGVGELAVYERLVEQGAWDQIAHDLESKRSSSPALTLLWVIAKREGRHGADDKQGMAMTREAIGAIASMLQVPETSPTALMISKRLLRRNPWNKAQKPSKKLSFGLMFLGLALGGGIGWLVTKFFL